MSASRQKGSKVTMTQDSFSWLLALIPKSIAGCNQSQTVLRALSSGSTEPLQGPGFHKYLPEQVAWVGLRGCSCSPLACSELGNLPNITILTGVRVF